MAKTKRKKKMLTRKQKAALEYLLAGDMTQKQIAAKLGVTEQTIVNWKKNDLFIDEFNFALKTNINTAAGKAFKRELELLDDADNDNVKLNAAKDILDRAGFKPDNIVNIRSVAAGLKNEEDELLFALNGSATEDWQDYGKQEV